MTGRHLSQLLDAAAQRRPDHPAVEDERGAALTYAQLHDRADRLAAQLVRWGLKRGDRVGIWTPKSLEAITAIHGSLRAGGVYVPVDPTGPAGRAATIFADGGAKVVVVSAKLAPGLREAWGDRADFPRLIIVDDESTNATIAEPDASWAAIMADQANAGVDLPDPGGDDDLAYILFTSGSTGRPKGVMLSHTNAFTFVDWCVETLDSWSDDDRFSSHAPLHFDLSIYDIFVSCHNAATLVLIGETLSKEPKGLGDFIADRRISVWYSAPSILAMMTEHGGIGREGYPAPRLVLFAGEVFPIAPLRRLRALWPQAKLWNLYGPTETNVCTAHPIPQTIGDDQVDPFPIGNVCPPLIGRVVDEEGQSLPVGAMGELVIAGPGVMLGYFGQPEQTAEAFFVDEDGEKWYRTGDLVIADESGCHEFRGRRDRMIKKRGYRIELGEIESALYRHEQVDRAAVVAEESEEAGVSISAFVSMKPGGKKSLIAMKRHCSIHLPNYMIPDKIRFLDGMPATSTDKVDYQKLKTMTTEGG